MKVQTRYGAVDVPVYQEFALYGYRWVIHKHIDNPEWQYRVSEYRSGLAVPKTVARSIDISKRKADQYLQARGREKVQAVVEKGVDMYGAINSGS